MVAACHHVNLAASAPPYSLFLDRHFPGFPRVCALSICTSGTARLVMSDLCAVPRATCAMAESYLGTQCPAANRGSVAPPACHETDRRKRRAITPFGMATSLWTVSDRLRVTPTRWRHAARFRQTQTSRHIDGLYQADRSQQPCVCSDDAIDGGDAQCRQPRGQLLPRLLQ